MVLGCRTRNRHDFEICPVPRECMPMILQHFPLNWFSLSRFTTFYAFFLTFFYQFNQFFNSSIQFQGTKPLIMSFFPLKIRTSNLNWLKIWIVNAFNCVRIAIRHNRKNHYRKTGKWCHWNYFKFNVNSFQVNFLSSDDLVRKNAINWMKCYSKEVYCHITFRFTSICCVCVCLCMCHKSRMHFSSKSHFFFCYRHSSFPLTAYTVDIFHEACI